MGLTFAELSDTPLGPISFIASDQGLRCTSFHTLSELKKHYLPNEVLPSLNGLETVKSLLKTMSAYLKGDRQSFDVEIDWHVISGFQRQVLELTYSIPYGGLMTYGEIARLLHKPGAARSVGRALGGNPMPIIIPCHRVVGADGSLRGFSGGINRKTFLLELEGHRIKNDCIISG